MRWWSIRGRARTSGELESMGVRLCKRAVLSINCTSSSTGVVLKECRQVCMLARVDERCVRGCEWGLLTSDRLVRFCRSILSVVRGRHPGCLPSRPLTHASAMGSLVGPGFERSCVGTTLVRRSPRRIDALNDAQMHARAADADARWHLDVLR